MGFDQDWEKTYASGTHLSVWPWSDIVSLVNRHCKPVITKGGGEFLNSVVVQEPISHSFLHLGWTIMQSKEVPQL